MKMRLILILACLVACAFVIGCDTTSGLNVGLKIGPAGFQLDFGCTNCTFTAHSDPSNATPTGLNTEP